MTERTIQDLEKLLKKLEIQPNQGERREAIKAEIERMKADR